MKICREPRNYPFFLKSYQKHILPVAETFAYCLLKNHFHLLVRIRTSEEQQTFLESLKDLAGFQNLPGLLKPHQQFSNLFNSYTKSIELLRNNGVRLHCPINSPAVHGWDPLEN